ncbi:MAG: MurR/RpiR family transcriptional regulator [Chloroflexi bacterium]|nr:MurR/RpiR family transcriptional regulator [Chloroflexota bacterium]
MKSPLSAADILGSTTETLLTHLRTSMTTLRAGERKVAQYVLERPEIVPQLTVIELGKHSGVSEATVLRLCQALGYRGYTEFKRRLIADLAASQAIAAAVAAQPYADVQDGDSLAAIFYKVLRMDVQALVDTAAAVSVEQIERAITLLLDARRIECYGVGGSGPVVQDAAYRLLRVGLDARCSTDSHLQVVHAALLGPEDVALCISHSGETQDTLDALEVAKSTGAHTLVITGFPDSPLARAADVTLVTATIGSRWRGDEIPARIVQLSLVDALCVALRIRRGEETTKIVIEKISAGLERKRRDLPATKPHGV